MSVWDVKAQGSQAPPPDLATVERARVTLFDGTAGVELRSLPSGRHRVVRAGDVAAVRAAVADLAGEMGLYYTLGPVPPNLGHPARKGDVLSYRWLMLDVDRVKGEADKDLSATDAEHEAARELAAGVQGWLSDQGWPAPVLVDSGNGWHVLYRVDLPNNNHSQALLRALLYALAAKFNDPARGDIDRSVHNPARVARLPGTWARKGAETPDRPHRPCRLVFVPESPAVVSSGLIRSATEACPQAPVRVRVGGSDEPEYERRDALAGAPGADDPPPPAVSPFLLRVSSKNHAAYGRAALEREASRVALAPARTRNNTLNDAAFRLGQLVAGGVLDQAAVEEWLYEAACRAGLDVDPGCGPRGIEATVRSGLEAGMQYPRGVPESPGRGPGRPTGSTNGAPPLEPLPEGQSILQRASGVQTTRVRWLWPCRIPANKLTTFAGVGGLGKTFVLCDITARVTRGLAWPDCSGECAEVGQVLFISGEDDPDDTLVPRMIEMGADLDRVCFLKPEAQDRFTLADLKMLKRALTEQGANVRLVVIDPPTAYLGAVDDHKNAELRGLLTPLKNFAKQHNVAIIFNTHLNKGSGAKLEAMMRVMGSVAWVNAVRSAYLFTRDPDDPLRRLFVGMKTNIGPERKGLAYRLTPTEELAKVEWLGEVETTADDAINGASKPRRVAAAQWLIERFQEKTVWPSDELFRAAKEAGIAKNAIFEAKDALDLPKARKVSHESGNISWHWWVPEDWPRLSAKHTPEVQDQEQDEEEDEEEMFE